MAAFLRWIEQNNQVPRRKLRDRLNPVEFYDAAEFLSTYRFSKETVLDLNRKTGPTVKRGSERNAAVPPMLRVALRFYATECFQRVDGDLFGRHNSTVCRIGQLIRPTSFSQRRRN